MPRVTAAEADQPFPTFASFVSSRLPIAFLRGVRPLIESSCETAYTVEPAASDGLPYWRNVQPHERNRLAFERVHQLSEELGLQATAKELDNGYFYLEIEAAGLTVHVKHLNNYQTLTEQMVKADYRRQMTTINSPFGQIPLFADDKPTAIPNEAYLILFYADGPKKSTAGSIFFVMPSNEEGKILASCEIEAAIAAYLPAQDTTSTGAEDSIDLPPKADDQEDEQAQ